MREHLYAHLAFLYGNEKADQLTDRLSQMLLDFQSRHPALGLPSGANRVSERDAILITYGDMVRSAGQTPLHTLADFLANHLSGVVSTIHLLPFYPYSSDDGFSVIDYKAVDPALGSWADVARFRRDFRLMFDAVVNHISAESAWFQAFLRDDPQYRDYFKVVTPGTDLSAVFRPRALPLLTPVETAAGPKLVWTTFSADQIDLNYANPDVLFEVLDTLLFYVAHGAEFIRLDAIAFLWKEIGTSSIHLPQTHEIIRLMRTVLDQVAPRVALITETNVPHRENISYFGDGTDEAQMVYNFPLPPLTLHAFHTESAETLTQWADSLTLPSERVTFFNFLASHDGVGLTPAKGILSDVAVAEMAERVTALGGHVSYKNNPDGTQSAYELNVNYLDALGDPARPDEDWKQVCRRFLASQAIMLALRGVPGIYFHSLFGSQNWREGVEQTGRFRTINRQKLVRADLARELSDPTSLRHQVLNGYLQLLRVRTAEPAFHPHGGQQILFGQPAIFALWRTSPSGEAAVLCLHNVTAHHQQLSLSGEQLAPAAGDELVDLLRDRPTPISIGRDVTLTLAPYEVRWLKSRSRG